MRPVLNSCQKGFTLIELMITLTILALLAMAALPNLSSYLANSKLRESANTLVATAVIARSEAIKRNGSVSLKVSEQTLTVVRESDSEVLRTVQLPGGVSTAVLTPAGALVASEKAVFNSAGQLSPFGTTIAITTSLPTKECASDIRCPAVLIEAGGATNVCPRGAALGVCL